MAAAVPAAVLAADLARIELRNARAAEIQLGAYVFAWWGRTVYRYRYIVIGVMVALCLGGGIFGMSLGKHVTQSGFYDEGSQSAKASGSPTTVRPRPYGHVVALFTAPDGKTVNDPDFKQKDSGQPGPRPNGTTQTKSCAPSAISRARTCWATCRTGTSSTRSCRSSSRATTTTPSLTTIRRSRTTLLRDRWRRRETGPVCSPWPTN